MKVEIKVPAERIANAMVAALESSYGSGAWLYEIRLVSPLEASIPKDGEHVWPYYARPALYDGRAFTIEVVYDGANDEEGSAASRRTITRADVQRGLETCAKKAGRAFAELFLTEDGGDAPAADEFLQCVVLGEVVYG